MYGRTPSFGLAGHEVKPGLAVVVHKAGEEVVGEPELKPGLDVPGDHPHPHPLGLLWLGKHTALAHYVSKCQL